MENKKEEEKVGTLTEEQFQEMLKEAFDRLEHSEAGIWCYKDGILCEHNLVDSPMIRKFICSGIGGHCECGSAYSTPYSLHRKGSPSSERRI